MSAFPHILNASGLSQREAAEYLDVAYDTIRSWLSGRRVVPPGALEDLRRLASRQLSAALDGAQAIERLVASAGDLPEILEVGFPVDEHEAQTLGFPTISAWSAMAGLMLAALPAEIASRVALVPRGTTAATASAADAHEQ